MIKVNIATTAPQFTKEDENRVLFKTQSDKDNWVKTHFTGTEETVRNIDLADIKKGYIKANVTNLEDGRNAQYLYIDVNGFKYFYFIDEVNIVTADTENNNYLLGYALTLDVITTYLDKVQWKGSTNVRRTHWDRTDSNGLIKFDPNSAIWNNEPDIDAKVSIRHKPLPFEFVNDSDRVGVEEYRKAFNVNKANLAIYGIFTGNATDKTPVYDNYRDVPYIDIISPLLSLVDGDDDITYRGQVFNAANSIYTGAVIASTKLNSIRVLSLPLDKHWERADGDLQWRKFKPDTSAHEEANIIITIDAEYDLKVKNPLYKKVDKTSNVFNPENETKLYSSQFMKIMLQSYSGEKVELINEFIKHTDEHLLYNFREDLITVEGVAHFSNNSYDTNLANYINIKNDFLLREELPSQSSAYNNFKTTHSQAFKTGVETNRLKGAFGVLGAFVGGGLGLATGTQTKANAGNMMMPGAASAGMAGVAAGGAIVNMAMQEKMYHAQIADLKNTPNQQKAINGSILSDWDIVATDRFPNSVINYGIITEELAEFDKFNVAMHLNKYGYETNKVMTFTKIDELERRSRFTYWECKNIQNAIVKGSVPKEVLNEINAKFGDGLRLWSPTEEINNYMLENWEL